MAIKEQLIIELIAENRQALASMQQYVQGAQKTAEKTGKITKLLKSYWGEALAAYAAVKKLWSVGKDLTDSFIKQEEAVAKMDSALRSTGIYTPEVSEAMQDLASQLQATTKYGDEATLAAAGLLQSLSGLNKDALMQTVPLVQDLATGMGIDLQVAASLVGKTLGSSTNALSRYGITLDMTGDQTSKLSALQTQINAKFKDMAVIMGGTFGGQVERLRNLFGDLKEVLGGILAENAEPFMRWMIEFLQNGKGIEIVARIFRGLGATIGTVIGFVIETIKSVIGYYKIWINASIQLGNILESVFNPKKWGTGELKKELRNLKDFTVETAIDVAKGWEDYALKSFDKWKKTFGDDWKPVIKTFRSDYELEMGKVVDATDDATESVVEYVSAWDKMREGQLEAIQAMLEIQTRQNEEMAIMSEQLPVVTDQMGLLSEQQIDFAAAMGKANDEMVAYNEKIKEQSDKYLPLWASSWQMMGDTQKSIGERMKEVIKDIIATTLQGIGREQFILALEALIPFPPWKFHPGSAAMHFAASAAAYGAAGVVRSLATGGQFVTSGPEFVQVGDNPSGRERVTVEPMGGGDAGAGFPSHITVQIGQYEFNGMVRREISSGNIPVWQGALTRNR